MAHSDLTAHPDTMARPDSVAHPDTVRYVVTGGRGFLGTHLRYRLALDPRAHVTCLGHDDADSAWREGLAGADVVLHCAGVNRADDDTLVAANVGVAQRLTAILDELGGRPIVAYAGSTYADASHPGSSGPYAAGKRRAGEHLRDWGARTGARVVELRLPGLFGEHGRPDYNSFVATFADGIARGEPPTVSNDRELPLLYVQDAVTELLRAADPGYAWPPRAGSGFAGSDSPTSDSPISETPTSDPQESPAGLVWPDAPSYAISDVANRLGAFYEVYAGGEIPWLPTQFDVRLFNTLRAAMWPDGYPFRPTRHTDPRGSLVETVRVHGGGGQTFVSLTNPGFVRGNHVHFEKIERFHVISGHAVIRLRRMLTDEVLEFVVDGEDPQVFDMPTFWSHSIENIGTQPLVTAFWSDALLDVANPDTYPLPVSPDEAPVDLVAATRGTASGRAVSREAVSDRAVSDEAVPDRAER